MVRHSQDTGLGSLFACESQSGSRRDRRGYDRAVRDEARRQPVQALESDEFRQLFSAAGKGSADSEEVGGRAGVGHPDGDRQNSADGGQDVAGATALSALLRRFLWLSAGQIGAGGDRRHQTPLLGPRLGGGVRHSGAIRQSRSRPADDGSTQALSGALDLALRRALAESANAKTRKGSFRHATKARRKAAS